MQITQKFQRALDIFVKVLKFVWRHMFVLTSLSITMLGIFEGKTPLIERELLVFTISAFLDWFKMKWKFSNGKNYHSSAITSFTQANYWNSNIIGTPAYLGNLGHRY